MIGILGIFIDMGHFQYFIDDKLTLVQVIALCRQTHKAIAYFSYVSGGPTYVQIYYNPLPPFPCMRVYDMSIVRTPLLRDDMISSCFEIFSDFAHYHLQAKVLPPRAYVSHSILTMQVWGTDLFCSPVGGIQVSLHAPCLVGMDDGKVMPCVMMKEYETHGLTMCEARCQHAANWEYALVSIWRSGNGNRPKICEIMFQ